MSFAQLCRMVWHKESETNVEHIRHMAKHMAAAGQEAAAG